jgi:hypothetical protein
LGISNDSQLVIINNLIELTKNSFIIIYKNLKNYLN